MARKRYTVFSGVDTEILGERNTKLEAFSVALQKMASRGLDSTVVTQTVSGSTTQRSWVISSGAEG